MQSLQGMLGMNEFAGFIVLKSWAVLCGLRCLQV